MDSGGGEIDVVRAQEEYQTKLDEHLRNQNQPKKKEAAPKRKESEFAALKKELTTAKTIAHYIEANHQTTLREAKGLLTFAQVISNRPEKLYTKLFRKYKPHITLVLERIVGFVQGSQGNGKLAKGQSSAGKASLTATAHEFLIRCERAGVHKKAWFAALKSDEDQEDSDSEDDGKAAVDAEEDDDDEDEKPQAGAVKKITIEGGTPTASATQRIADVLSAHLTPKIMLKMLSEVDVMGRLTRMIEITTSVDTCKDVAERIAGAEEISGSEKVQLHTRLLSKVRRLIAPFGSSKAADADADEKPATTGNKAATAVVVATREEALSIVKLSLDLSYELFIRQKLAPTTKYAKFLEWCKADGTDLIPEGYTGLVDEVDTENDNAMLSQANAIEVLLALKAAEDGGVPDDRVGWGESDEPAPPGEEKVEQKKGTVRVFELTQVINTVSGTATEGGVTSEYFTVTGMDVLSAIAVSAGKKLVSDDLRTPTDKDEGAKNLRSRVVEMLINSVKRSNGTLSLPRRAVNFIADEKKKQQVSDVAALRKKRAREDADRAHLLSSRQIQEEIDGDDLMDRE